MRLLIFNPEHDISLAVNQKRFTLPRAVESLRHTFSFLPILWAAEGDLVLVEDVEKAVERCANLSSFCVKGEDGWLSKTHFVTPDMLLEDALVSRITDIEAWGIDQKLKTYLIDLQPRLASLLPTDEVLSTLRMASARSWAAHHLLPELLQLPFTVGEATQYTDYTVLHRALRPHQNYVVKAPWSSSGRGVRLLEPRWHQAEEGQPQLTDVEIHQENWVKNIIRSQGSIMMEPYMEGKIIDFGVELEASAGRINYCGLSVFKAENGAYLGNVLDSEAHKRSLLATHVRLETLDAVIQKLMTLLAQRLPVSYHGPLGVDMMLLEGGRIAPMIELNLRRTMGHVAIDLYAKTQRRGWMRLNAEKGCVEILE